MPAIFSNHERCGGTLLENDGRELCFKCGHTKGPPEQERKYYFEITGAIGEKSSGLPATGKYGVPFLDSSIGGLHPGDLVVISGRSSGGKTFLATHISIRAALQGLHTFYISTDMPKSLMLERFKLGLGVGTKYDKSKDVEGKIVLADFLPLTSVGHQGLLEIVGHALRDTTKSCQLLVFDDIDSFGGDLTDSGIRYYQIGAIMSSIRTLCQTLGATALVISQLNQEGALSESQRKFHKADVIVNVDLQGAMMSMNLRKNRITGILGAHSQKVLWEYMSLAKEN